MKTLATVAALACFALAGSARAGSVVIYQTGFQTPPFTLGPLAGQDGWSVFGNPAAVEVERPVARSGHQAVLVRGALAPTQTGPFRSSPSSATQITMSADIELTNFSGDQGAWQFAALGPGLAPFDGGIDIDPNGTIHAITAGFPVIGSFSFNDFHHVDVRLNYAAQTYSVLLDGVTLASGVAFCGDNGPCSGAPTGPFDTGLFDTFGGSHNDRGYFDNYRVAAIGVPEPSAWALALLGLAGLGASLRSRRRSPDPA